MERRVVFDALDQVLSGGGFLKQYLSGASSLAFEIASGVMRQKRVLEEHIQRLNRGHRLKRKEKIVLMIALYQYIYLDRVPTYALVDESVKLAKEVCHPIFARFCNAFLRKLPPKDELQTNDLSYPDFLIDHIDRKHLEIMNLPPILYARHRPSGEMHKVSDLKKTAADPDYYIQNPTPWKLMQCLAEKSPQPEKILDLCGAPGGKSIALHDLYPSADLTINDPSEERLEKVHENCKKYGVDPKITSIDGTDYPTDEMYDLIVIDAPCSNTGVLGKRPEARWRCDDSQVDYHVELQRGLIEASQALLTAKGVIWYLTCAILPQENEEVANAHGAIFHETIYPDESGNDGGFCALIPKIQM